MSIVLARLLELFARAKQGAQHGAYVRIVRVDGDGAAIAFHGFIDAFELIEHVPEIGVQLGGVGAHGNGAAVHFHRFLGLPGGAQRIPEIVINAGTFGLSGEPLVEDVDRLIETLRTVECVAECLQCDRIVRLNCQRAPGMVDRGVNMALRPFRRHEIHQSGGSVIRIGRTCSERGRQEEHRLLECALPDSDTAKQMQGLKVARRAVQQLDAAVRRLGEPACLEVLQGHIEHVLCDSVTSRFSVDEPVLGSQP